MQIENPFDRTNLPHAPPDSSTDEEMVDYQSNQPHPRTIADIQRRLSTHLQIEQPDQNAVQQLAPLLQQAMQAPPKTPATTIEYVEIDYSLLARHLQVTYLHDTNLSERDVHQIRFVLSVYGDRDNLSADLTHDVCSQIVLF